MAQILKARNRTRAEPGKYWRSLQGGVADSEERGEAVVDPQAAPLALAHAIDRRVAGRIRLRRLAVGLTQHQLAVLLGVAFQQVHKYETGASRISAGRLYVVAKALKAPIAYFFLSHADPAEPEATIDLAEREDGHGE